MLRQEKKAFLTFLRIVVCLFVYMPSVTLASRLVNQKNIEIEKAQIEQMVIDQDVEGLIEELIAGECESKALAAEHLGYFGDERALRELQVLNEKHGGWRAVWSTGEYYSGAFAVAICQILTRDQTPEEQVSALFDLLEGKGPAVPDFVREAEDPESTNKNKPNGSATVQFSPQKFHGTSMYVGVHVARALAEYNDPRIVPTLRNSRNFGVASTAVWLEVRDMKPSDAIKCCLDIIHYEDRYQRNGAIHCLGRFGDQGVEPLKALVREGFSEPLRILSTMKDHVTVPDYGEFLKEELLSNNNAGVRREAASQLLRFGEKSDSSVQGLIEALHDPVASVRSTAASSLRGYFIFRKPENCSEDVIQGLRRFAGHEDPDVASLVREILKKNGWNDPNAEVMALPAMRTDLGDQLVPSNSYEMRIKQAQALEPGAKKALDFGSPEEAIKLYEQLLEIFPKNEAYHQAIEMAKAYQVVAEHPRESWDPDASYYGIRGHYEYLLAQDYQNFSVLEDMYRLARHLPGLITISSSKQAELHYNSIVDLHSKARRLFQIVIEHAPSNEYITVDSHYQWGRLREQSEEGIAAQIEAYLYVLSIEPSSMIDSTSNIGTKASYDDPQKT
jgi:tetratricopeptide (TPR) repeat protein